MSESMFKTVGSKRSLKASERLAREIARTIVDGDLDEGDRLPHERDMLEQLDVGRATLREALRLLESWGLVTIRTGPGGGPVVRRPQPQDFADQLSLMLHFHQFTLADVSDARLALEPQVARLAAEKISKAEIDALKKTIDVMREHLDDEDVFFEQNRIFHSTIADASGSRIIQIFQDSLKEIGEGASAGVQYSAPQFQVILDSHSRIVDALEAGDPDLASREMYSHLNEGRRYVARRFSRALDRPIRGVASEDPGAGW